MSAVYALLSFLAAVAAVAAGYRVWEKRSTTQPSSKIASPKSTKPPISESSKPTADPTALLPLPTETTPTIAQTEPKSPVSVLSTSAPKVSAASSSIIPDPWLDEPQAPTEAVDQRVAPAEPLSSVSRDNRDRVNLPERILRLGNSGQINQVPYLIRYANDPDAQVRSAVAKALGTLATHWRGTVVERMIPALGKLSQDNQSEVRLAAVEALGKIQSIKVLPWLQRAQKYADGSVRKAATAALQRLKLTYQPKQIAIAKPKPNQPGKR